MSDTELRAILADKRGIGVWNSWRVMHEKNVRIDLRGIDLHGTNLRGANLAGVDLSKANLGRANLGSAILSGGVDLSRANLHEANLSEAILNGANLQGADLSGADLHGADLSEADLHGANLHGANLYKAYLVAANFNGAFGLEDNYQDAQSLSIAMYTGLNTLEAIRNRGLQRVLPAVFAAVWLVYELFELAPRAFPRLAAAILPYAIAAPSDGNPATFTPPLGLSQSLFNVVLFIFVLVTVVMIGILLWAGFLAKTKNVKAATLVEHFGTFLLGSFFGTKL